MDGLFRFESACPLHPAVLEWMAERRDPLGLIAERWFNALRDAGDDVNELLHDGHPTACVQNTAFAYVNAFSKHVNVGFFRGAELDDPHGLLEGSGRFMRHVKLRPGDAINEDALIVLIDSAYGDMRARLGFG